MPMGIENFLFLMDEDFKFYCLHLNFFPVGMKVQVQFSNGDTISGNFFTGDNNFQADFTSRHYSRVPFFLAKQVLYIFFVLGYFLPCKIPVCLLILTHILSDLYKFVQFQRIQVLVDRFMHSIAWNLTKFLLSTNQKIWDKKHCLENYSNFLHVHLICPVRLLI